jgi:hypothetical protein
MSVTAALALGLGIGLIVGVGFGGWLVFSSAERAAEDFVNARLKGTHVLQPRTPGGQFAKKGKGGE